MAVARASGSAIKQIPYVWEGTDKVGKKVKGEMLAPGEAFVRQSLRRQGINVIKVRKQGPVQAPAPSPARTSPCLPVSFPPC
jgi:type II secretory pathway component PulF